MVFMICSHLYIALMGRFGLLAIRGMVVLKRLWIVWLFKSLHFILNGMSFKVWNKLRQPLVLLVLNSVLFTPIYYCCLQKCIFGMLTSSYLHTWTCLLCGGLKFHNRRMGEAKGEWRQGACGKRSSPSSAL